MFEYFLLEFIHLEMIFFNISLHLHILFTFDIISTLYLYFLPNLYHFSLFIDLSMNTIVGMYIYLIKILLIIYINYIFNNTSCKN